MRGFCLRGDGADNVWLSLRGIASPADNGFGEDSLSVFHNYLAEGVEGDEAPREFGHLVDHGRCTLELRCVESFQSSCVPLLKSLGLSRADHPR